MKRSSAPGSSSTATFGFLDMAPQPLSRVKRDCSIVLGDPTSLTRDPAIGAAFSSAIAAWSYVESLYGTILVQLLGAQAEPALSMLHALKSASAQDQALAAAASAVLGPEELDLFIAATTVARRQREQRNDLAHGVVGHSEDVPNAIIIVDPKYMQMFWLDMFVKKRVTHIDAKSFAKDAFDKFCDQAMVYKRKELERRASQFDGVASMLMNVAVIVSRVHHGKAQALEELRSLPDIEAQLSRQKKHQKARQQLLE